MKAIVKAIEYALPEKVLSTAQLASEFPEWSVEKIDAKTGIRERHIAAPDECASDLAVSAVKKLFASGASAPESIDFLLLCTQTPDYLLPTTACLLQERLRLSRQCGALDFNLGSSGFIHGLGLAQGLIETGQARNILLITADTYSKLIHPRDRSVRTIFGDAAAVTLISAEDRREAFLGPYIHGTDGSGGPHLMVPAGGMRHPRTSESLEEKEDESGNVRSAANLYMNGLEIFDFTLTVVPQTVAAILAKSGLTFDDIDLVVFHQANQSMLEHLRRKIGIPANKFYICLAHCGNTVSATIPIALKHALAEGRIREGSRVLLVGFGVGYSWGATLLRWSGSYFPPGAF
ncbi:MAG: ketoacyl-ACP synthase III [Bryobacterales bacterium]|nr:ketoacyl-ACP synthase III [Bryobacterales bacterium]